MHNSVGQLKTPMSAKAHLLVDLLHVERADYMFHDSTGLPAPAYHLLVELHLAELLLVVLLLVDPHFPSTLFGHHVYQCEQ